MVGPPRLPDWGSVVACSTPKPVTMVIIMHGIIYNNILTKSYNIITDKEGCV